MSSSPPIILFPSAGCQPAGTMDAEAFAAHVEKLHATVRRCWTEEGVKACVELLEMRAAQATGHAILPGASAHDQGMAYGMAQLAYTLRRAAEE